MTAAIVGPTMPMWSARRGPILAPMREPSNTNPAMAKVLVVRASPTDVAGMPRSCTIPSIDTLNALNDTWIWHIITIASGNQEAFAMSAGDAGLGIR